MIALASTDQIDRTATPRSPVCNIAMSESLCAPMILGMPFSSAVRFMCIRSMNCERSDLFAATQNEVGNDTPQNGSLEFFKACDGFVYDRYAP